jgi:hypothetical protein
VSLRIADTTVMAFRQARRRRRDRDGKPSHGNLTSASEVELIIRRFESPDETRVMEKGKFEVVTMIDAQVVPTPRNT